MTPEQKIRDFRLKYGRRLKAVSLQVTEETADVAYRLVEIRTREGGGTNGPLKKLSGKYIAFRRRWASFLDDETSPAKSNLTATGQLLKALYLRVSGTRFFIKINNKKRYQALGGGGEGMTNNQIRDYQEKQGREFLKLSPLEDKQIRQFARERYEDYLSDFIKKNA